MTSAEINIRILLAAGVIIVTVRMAGWVFGRLGQPRVVGEIVAGILLGPSVLGVLIPTAEAYLFPDPVVDGLRTVAQFGLVIFMFLIGLDVDTGVLRRSGRTVAIVAPTSVLVPFLLAAGFGWAVYPTFGNGTSKIAFSVFFGAAMAVTAFPVLARLLIESGLSKHRIGSVTLVCAAVNDLAAWLLVGVVVAVLSGSPGHALLTAALCAAFVAVMLLIIGPLVRAMDAPPLWMVLVLALSSAWIAEQSGAHAIIGGFLAGLAMPRRAEWRDHITERLGHVVSIFLLPIFFAVVGVATRVDQLTMAGLVLLAGATAIAIAGKLGGSAVAARCAGESWPDALRIGVLMNTRGITEIVILTVGLELAIITSTVYTAMVLMAVITTFMTAPILQFLNGRTGTEAAIRQPSASATGGGSL
ncbi:cation:proton antiporter [Nocardia sp. NPDC003979]